MVRAVLVAMVLHLLAPACWSDCCDSGCWEIYWENAAPLEYAINTATCPMESHLCRMRVTQMMQEWVDADATGASLLSWSPASYDPWVGTAVVATNDNMNTLLWLQDWSGFPAAWEIENEMGAFTADWQSSGSVDTYLNDQYFSWQDLPAADAASRSLPLEARVDWLDVGTVVLHELGHWLALEDLSGSSDCRGCIMWHEIAPSSISDVQHELGLGDQYGVCAIYGGTGTGDLQSFDVLAGDGYVDVEWHMYVNQYYEFALYVRESGGTFVCVYEHACVGTSFGHRDEGVQNGQQYEYMLCIDGDFTLPIAVVPSGQLVLATYSALTCAEVPSGIEVAWSTTHEDADLAGFDVYRTIGWEWTERGDKYAGSFSKVNAAVIPPSTGVYEYVDSGAVHGHRCSYLVVARSASGSRQEREGPACNACWRPYPANCDVGFAPGQSACPLLCPGGDSEAIDVLVTLRDSCGYPVQECDAFFALALASPGGDFLLCCDEDEPTVFSSHVATPTLPTDHHGESLVTLQWAGGADTLVAISVAPYGQGPIPVELTCSMRSPDLNADCSVGLPDFVLFASQFGTGGWEADLDGDGWVGLQDLVLLESHFGHSCGRLVAERIPEQLTADLLGNQAASGEGTAAIALSPASPNPSVGSAEIAYRTPRSGTHVILEICSSSGRRVMTLVDGTVTSGWHTAVWGGTDETGAEVASGVYFCQLNCAGETHRTKLVLLR